MFKHGQTICNDLRAMIIQWLVLLLKVINLLSVLTLDLKYDLFKAMT